MLLQIPQSRADAERKPRTPPTGREVRRGTRGRHRCALQHLCHRSGHSLSCCIECFPYAALMTASCMLAIMLEPAFRAVSGSHMDCILHPLTLRISP